MSPTPKITLITRSNCPLCDEAEAVIDQVAKRFPVEVARLDVDQDPNLKAKYDLMVPVVLLNGVEVFYGKVSAVRLTRMVRETPAEDPPQITPRYHRHLERLRSFLRGRS